MDSKFYNNADAARFDSIRLKLALFDEDTVRGICDLVNYRGTEALLDDVFHKSTPADPPHILGIMGPEYMKYQDMPGVILGIATILLSAIRKPSYGHDEYANILKEAFGLPELLARKYAERIESYDEIIADANRDGNTELSERITQYLSVLEEGARRVVNNLANSFGLSTLINWDQGQTYDHDFLAEVYELGKVVSELNRRARLVSGQALISAQLNVLHTGDIEESGDPIAELVGDILSANAAKPLPPALMGNFRDTMYQSAKVSADAGNELFRQAGLRANKDGRITANPTSGNGKKIKNVIGRVLKGNPLMATILGAIGGSKTKKKLIEASSSKPADSALAGDIGSLYGDIATGYGEPVADAWLIGDLDALASALQVAESGDTQSEMYALDDATVGDQETGFPFFGKKAKQRRQHRKEAKRNALKRKDMAFDAAQQRKAYVLKQRLEAKNRAAAQKVQDEYLNFDPRAGFDAASSSEMLDAGLMDDQLLNQVDDFDPLASFEYFDQAGSGNLNY